MSASAFAAWIDATSLWWIAFWLLVAMIAVSQAANVLRRRLKRTRDAAGIDVDDEDHGAVVSAALGLLALLLTDLWVSTVAAFPTIRGVDFSSA